MKSPVHLRKMEVRMGRWTTVFFVERVSPSRSRGRSSNEPEGMVLQREIHVALLSGLFSAAEVDDDAVLRRIG